MRKAILTLAIALFSVMAFDALACSKCGTYPTGCDYCYETGYDGAVACELWQGEYCMLTEEGACKGYLDQWCPGGHCPDDQQARAEQPEKEWQLASVTIVRVKPAARPARHAARS
ncbi:MAG TPA: hypothetical protein VJZ00_03285 [Thermoanaerobaculia bacterium]|nr:hypothetical protein [Thermoanaerobaculia bacterium]